ncbi:Uncharacterized conserved protein, DUF2147 family [Afipia sp. GAS231]|nr:Uncharacterized conserved protein, DUF2147 family [Afipia sp. GAS231]
MEEKGVDHMGLVSSITAVCLALAIGIATSGNANAQTDGDLSGIWLTQDQGSTVRISRCSRGYCGSIVNATKGAVDANNPDLRLRTRPLEGLMILQAPTPTADGFAGQLYNPRDGKSYSGRLVVTGKNSLSVTGCVMGVFCRSQAWVRSQ